MASPVGSSAHFYATVFLTLFLYSASLRISLIDILNRKSVDHECDRRTDGQTDR